MTLYGYARVSTDRQDTDAQQRALEAAGCNEIVTEQASGRRARPALAGLLDRLQAGDVLTVWKIDRLSRSAPDFYRIAQQLTDRGTALRSLTEAFDTSTPIGRAMMGFLAIFAQLEAEHTTERVKAGLAAAKARGRVGGRPPALSPELEAEIRLKLADGAEVKTLARTYQVSAPTIRRIRQRG